MLMKLSKLLATRQSILRQAILANLADAYITLKGLGDRMNATGLRGAVKLYAANPNVERYWPAMIALEGNQSVVEEHFADQEIVAMADAIVFATESESTELAFRVVNIEYKIAPH